MEIRGGCSLVRTGERFPLRAGAGGVPSNSSFEVPRGVYRGIRISVGITLIEIFKCPAFYLLPSYHWQMGRGGEIDVEGKRVGGGKEREWGDI